MLSKVCTATSAVENIGHEVSVWDEKSVSGDGNIVVVAKQIGIGDRRRQYATELLVSRNTQD